MLAGKNGTPPSVPKRGGYTFSGWSPDNYYLNVTSSRNITANYVSGDVKMHTVYFYGLKTGSDNYEVLKVERVPEGGSAQPPVLPGYAGHTFWKWQGDYSNIDLDKNIYALYNINTYTVNFWNGSTLLKSQEVQYKRGATTPAEPNAPEGYYFSGWDKDYGTIEKNLDVYELFELTAIEEYIRRIQAYNLPKELEEKLIELGIESKEWADGQSGGSTRIAIPATLGLLIGGVAICFVFYWSLPQVREAYRDFASNLADCIGALAAYIFTPLYQQVTESLGTGGGTEAGAIAVGLGDIASQYGDFECWNAAIAMEEYLKKQKQEYKFITMEYPNRGTIISLSREAIFGIDSEASKISINGFHYGIEYNGIVYCNVHPFGLPRSLWEADFWGVGQAFRTITPP